MALGSDALRAFCLDFSAAVAEYPFPRNPHVCCFKVEGKVFALSTLALPVGEPLAISLKCDPDIAIALRGAHRAIVPGYHLNKRHWNTVTVDGSLPDGLVEEMIQDSFDLVVNTLPRHQRLRLR